MKPKTRIILGLAIEQGVKRGYIHAFKHTDSPTEEHILYIIDKCVMEAVDEYFSFDEEDF